MSTLTRNAQNAATDAEFTISLVYLKQHGNMLQLDGYPATTTARLNAPGQLPPGIAMTSFDVPDLDALNLEAMVHYGGVLSPFNAWLILRGAATLPLRMKAHEETALAVARYLEEQDAISHVFYPGLPSHPQHDLARRQMRNFSGMLTFRTRDDGRAVAERMIDRLRVIHYAVSLGHHRSLIYWIPTEMLMQSTFRLGPDAEARYRDFAGDGVFRFSVGIEDADDLCADLERVL